MKEGRKRKEKLTTHTQILEHLKIGEILGYFTDSYGEALGITDAFFFVLLILTYGTFSSNSNSL